MMAGSNPDFPADALPPTAREEEILPCEQPLSECADPDVYDESVEGHDRDLGARPDLWLYRDRTTGLLWRYTRLAVELGRLPSLLGREFFRARVTRYDAQTFEDSVIFVHDLESCLDALEPADKIVIAMLALEEYTQEEAARYLHCTQRTIIRHFGEALDRLSEIFLKREILWPLPGENTIPEKSCQEAETAGFSVTH
ncbi:MAG TPA: sigma factor-like helix-turn-helix DNA-binding protein [Terriglobales bacterium]|nr:sigma factor-like helix-turn-helix DNA-binding protein [Terriglobales bacterium]